MPQFIARDRVRELMDHGAQVVEVLERSQYDEAHLPGALSIPLWEFDGPALAQLQRDRAVVVYCYDNE